MTTRLTYAELVGEAEKAVAAVQDPELKRVAFERVLDSLLQRESHSSTVVSRSKTAGVPAKRSTKKSGAQSYILELLADGFFNEPHTIANVKAELANRGRHFPLTALSTPLQRLCRTKMLRRHKTASGKRSTYTYSKH